MIELGGVRWTNENPAIYLSFYYEKERIGAAMRYRVQVNLSAVTGASSFGYDVNLGVYMDGAWKTGTQLVRTGEKQWAAKAWTSDWITIPDKTSGTTTVSFNVYSTGGARRNGTYSYAMAVDPAASTLSAASGTLGQAQTLNLTRYSAAFKDTITWSCGTASGTIAALSQETTFAFTPPMELASQAPNAAAVEIRFTVATYQADGTTLVATSSTTIAAAIPETVKPSCALAVSDTTGSFAAYGAYVQGRSRLHLVVTPTLAYGSAIASYQIVADGKTYTASDVTTDPIAGSGTLTLTARVTDRRGRTSDAATVTITVLPCAAPQISSFTSQRCGADGTADEEGLYIKVTFSASISPLNHKNTAAYRVRYKKTGTEDWTTVTLTDYAGQYAVTNGTTVFAAAAADAWDVQISAQDAFTETAQTRSVPIAFSLVNYNASGRGLAFGRISQIEDTFEVDMPARFYKGVSGIFPVGAIYLSVTDVSPAELFGGTWEQIKDTFFLAAGDTYAAGSTGGEAEHTLTTTEMPYHSHTILLNSASSVSYDTWDYSYGASKANRSYYSQGPAEPIVGGAGGSGAHNNMPPYLSVYAWKRIE